MSDKQDDDNIITPMSAQEGQAYARKMGFIFFGILFVIVLLGSFWLSQVKMEMPEVDVDKFVSKTPFATPDSGRQKKIEKVRIEKKRSSANQQLSGGYALPSSVLSPPPVFPKNHPGFNRYIERDKEFAAAGGYVTDIVPRRDMMVGEGFVLNNYARVEYYYPNGARCYFHQFMGPAASPDKYRQGQQVIVGYQPAASDPCGSSYISDR